MIGRKTFIATIRRFSKKLRFIRKLALLGALSPAIAWSQTNDQAVLLQYHHVSNHSPASTSLSLEAFTEHMLYLHDNDFSILPLEDVINRLQAGLPLPNKSAVITFDDAYRSVYTNAFPLLREYNWPFTIFVSPGLITNNSSLYLNWEQINEMADAGATIANHTVTHLHLLEVLSEESEDQWLQRIEAEIIQAETEIKEQTQQNHKILAYPYGEYNPAIQNLLRHLGFIGIAQHSGPINAASDFEALPRFPFSGIYASMNTFPVKINSLAFSMDSILPLSPITDKTRPEAQLQFPLGAYQLDLLSCYNNGQRIEVKRDSSGSEGLYRVKSHIDNQGRRFRYNCTNPSPSGRYYWYSLNWINPGIAE